MRRMDERPRNVNDDLLERITLILDEMTDRMDNDDLSHRDEIALRAAVSKAAVAGFTIGAAQVAWTAALHGIDIEVNFLNEVDYDLYRAKFGDED